MIPDKDTNMVRFVIFSDRTPGLIDKAREGKDYVVIVENGHEVAEKKIDFTTVDYPWPLPWEYVPRPLIGRIELDPHRFGSLTNTVEKFISGSRYLRYAASDVRGVITKNMGTVCGCDPYTFSAALYMVCGDLKTYLAVKRADPQQVRPAYMEQWTEMSKMLRNPEGSLLEFFKDIRGILALHVKNYRTREGSLVYAPGGLIPYRHAIRVYRMDPEATVDGDAIRANIKQPEILHHTHRHVFGYTAEMFYAKRYKKAMTWVFHLLIHGTSQYILDDWEPYSHFEGVANLFFDKLHLDYNHTYTDQTTRQPRFGKRAIHVRALIAFIEAGRQHFISYQSIKKCLYGEFKTDEARELKADLIRLMEKHDEETPIPTSVLRRTYIACCRRDMLSEDVAMHLMLGIFTHREAHACPFQRTTTKKFEFEEIDEPPTISIDSPRLLYFIWQIEKIRSVPMKRRKYKQSDGNRHVKPAFSALVKGRVKWTGIEDMTLLRVSPLHYTGMIGYEERPFNDADPGFLAAVYFNPVTEWIDSPMVALPPYADGAELSYDMSLFGYKSEDAGKTNGDIAGSEC